MGLDMYLYRRNKGETELPDEEEYYWRKANQIRQWIVKHTGYPQDANMTEHLLTKAQLEALVHDCKAVLEKRNLAPEIMPTSQGFCYGSDAYSKGYFNDLRNTFRVIEDILAETDFETQEIVYWEWW